MAKEIVKKAVRINNIPALLYGGPSDGVWLFVHGRCGCKEEGEAFAETVCPKGRQVLAFDLPEHGERKGEPGFDPWHAVPELRAVMGFMAENWGRMALRANSIGAWFSMLALGEAPLEKALFVSPLLDMEGIIRGMMSAFSVDEERLRREGEISAAPGETLSWRYLEYAKENRITSWAVPTEILYGGMDGMTSRETAEDFCRRFGCGLTVMEKGEHWFHTPEQLSLMKNWENSST